MNNLIYLIGRLQDDPQKENDKVIMNLKCTRNYKNEDGIYEEDLIQVSAYNGIAEHTLEYIHKNDLVGIKGRIQTTKMASGSTLEIIVDKLSFLSSQSKEINEELEK